MVEPWPTVRLGTLLKRIKDDVLVDDAETYSRLTIRMNGNGIVLRDSVPGTAIGTKRQFIARTGQLVLSKIDARNGAFGILPPACDNAIITGNFWAFDINGKLLIPKYFEYFTKSPTLVDFCIRASEGTTNRRYLQERRFLAQTMPLPPLDEQRRIVARIEAIAAKVEEAQRLRWAAGKEAAALLRSEFARISEGASRRGLGDVAPLVRRPVRVALDDAYPEVGVRSFGKGTFHKPALPGAEVGSKKLFQIRNGDLLFNIVFAWEGAIAVATPEDDARVGSHRFLTCVPNPGLATPHFLCFYFLTPEGLAQVGAASPGGAGRNRTLGLKAAAEMKVPVPPIEIQRRFDRLQEFASRVAEQGELASAEFDALIPSVIDRAIRGEL